jgi:hypothetical protein
MLPSTAHVPSHCSLPAVTVLEISILLLFVFLNDTSYLVSNYMKGTLCMVSLKGLDMTRSLLASVQISARTAGDQ